MAKRRSNRKAWEKHFSQTMDEAPTRNHQPSTDRLRTVPFEQPEAFKVTGVTPWFLIEKPEHRPYTPSGGMRDKALNGIYMDVMTRIE